MAPVRCPVLYGTAGAPVDAPMPLANDSGPRARDSTAPTMSHRGRRAESLSVTFTTLLSLHPYINKMIYSCEFANKLRCIRTYKITIILFIEHMRIREYYLKFKSIFFNFLLD